MLTSEPAASAEDKLLRAPPAMDTARHSRDDHLIQLDPAPQRGQFAPGGGVPPTTSSKAPVDFGDVFGGPPRRLSGNADGAGGDAGAGGSASVAEKPVFGSPAGRPRRRHLGDDFFSDIFRGDESAGCPTLRRRDDRDLFPPSSPATSRVLSPTLHLPASTSDVFGGVSAVPAHLSYSSRLAKSFDYSSFRSPPSLAVCQLGASDPDVFSVPSSPMVCAGETDKLFKKAPAGSKAYSGSGHFHFSIYKWASKGVTLIMPSSFKERAKGGSRLGAVSSQVWHREDLPLDNGGMSQGIHCFQNSSGSVEDKIPVDGTPASSRTAGYSGSSSNEVTETLPAASDMRSGTSGSHARDSRVLPEEEGKPRLKNLHELINESSDQGEGDEVSSSRQSGRKEGLANEKVKAVMKHVQGTEKVKLENKKNTIVDCAETSSQQRHSAPKILEEKVLPARAKGRVKEYIKNFNQEVTEKTCGDPVETRTRGPKGKEKVEDCTSANSDQQDNGNYMEASSIPLCAGQSMKEEHRATMKGLGVEKVDGSYQERNIGVSFPLSGSTPDILDASFCNMEELRNENIEECLVGELPQDHKEVTEADLHQEENKTKMSDTRIQEWSKGKEGNIRSLLSTLQYVLWTGCGWKPVPLVDIIEGASVRRAYQKALLCLHPDKLQQKGAETHQKYVAEKVFDILQESWDYFNSLSSL